MSKSLHQLMRFVRPAFALLAVGLLVNPPAKAGVFPNGVNLQPTYYNNGNVNFAWSLMNSKTNIQACRLEIDFSRGLSVSQFQSWISQARANNKTLAVTFHNFGGSDSASDLATAANWWRTNYSALNSAGSFTINLCNEWGSHNQTATSYSSAYNSAIATVRQVYSGRIICDVPGWGQEMQVAQQAAPRISDQNIILSAHIYPGNFDQLKGRGNVPSDLDDLNASGRPCIIGEFGTGSGSTDWSAMVDKAASLGWTRWAWSWNGDGGVLNMVSPSWAQNSTAQSFTTNSYFNTVYPKLSGGSTTPPPPPPPPPPGGLANGTYKIVNRNSGQALDAFNNGTANGTQIIQWPYTGGTNQRWTVTSLGGGQYQIIGVQSGRSLDVAAGGTANGTKIELWDSNGGNNQKFIVTATSGGFYRISPANASGSCLDVTGASTTNGALVQLFTYSGGNNQQWAFQAP